MLGSLAVAVLLVGGCGDDDDSGFDVEEWRAEAVAEFGPEQEYDDGTKDDYVAIAESICAQSDAERSTMRENLGDDYDGSMQEYILETYCPNVT